MRSLILVAAFPLVACSLHSSAKDDDGLASSSQGTARNYQVTDFTAVALRGPDDVAVTVGHNFVVRASGPSDQLDQLKITKDGDTLMIGRKSGSSGSISSRRIKVFVTMPSIAAATIAGSGDLSVDRAAVTSFKGTIAGSGDLSLGRIAVDDATFSIPGSGDITVAGTANTVSFTIAGSGDIDAAGLTAGNATVSTVGSGDVTARIIGNAKVSIVGSGDVNLGPDATCDVNKVGSGDVVCKD